MVGTGAPFHMICAPYTNADPDTVTVVVPSEKPDGVTAPSTGIGFRTDSVTVPAGRFAEGGAEQVTVTELGTGTIAGAVYTPLLSIVPISALPPGTPLTE